MKNYIKKYYLSVSDSDIAERFGVNTQSVSVARRRMGLRKSEGLALSLRNKRRELGRGGANFDNFW